MKRSLCFFWVGMVVLAGPAAHAQHTPAPPTPLFTSHELLTLTIEAPFKKVFRERNQDPEQFPAVITYRDAEGAEVSVDLKLQHPRTFPLAAVHLQLPTDTARPYTVSNPNSMKRYSRRPSNTTTISIRS